MRPNVSFYVVERFNRFSKSKLDMNSISYKLNDRLVTHRHDVVDVEHVPIRVQYDVPVYTVPINPREQLRVIKRPSHCPYIWKSKGLATNSVAYRGIRG